MSSQDPMSGDDRPVMLDSSGDVIAAIPHMLGYYPVRSLVTVGWANETPAQPIVAIRSAFPGPTEQHIAIEAPLRVAITQSLTRVTLIVIDDDRMLGPLPYRDLVVEYRTLFLQAGIEVVESLWTATTAEGGVWRCYDDDTRTGDVPDPRSTTLAALRARAGHVTYPRREDLAAILTPAADDVLARRADLLTMQQDSVQQHTGEDLCRLVETAVDRAVSGVMPDTDAEFVHLAMALADGRVRDAFLDIPDVDRRAAAERLWAHLVRGLPGADRADPASLLAFSAYGRGDGVLAQCHVA